MPPPAPTVAAKLPPAPAVAATPPPAVSAPPTVAQQSPPPAEQARAEPSASEPAVPADATRPSSTVPAVASSAPPPPATAEPAQSPVATAAATSQAPATESPQAPPADGGARDARRSSGPTLDASWSGNQPPEWTCPQAARLRRLEKLEARLSVHIDDQGRVAEARVSVSSGFTRFDAFAIETVKKWRFTPRIVEGQPTAEWYHDWAWSVPCEY
ncbi:MAG: energy transducer TonB [Betaproteobacteria bacterium]